MQCPSSNAEVMKKILLLTCMLWAMLSATGRETKSKDPVLVAFVRMDIFYFKVDKEFVGAELEIYSQEGEKLFSDKISHRKVIVDFYYEDPGRYVIYLTKGVVRKEFNFTKDKPCPENERPTTFITVSQGFKTQKKKA